MHISGCADAEELRERVRAADREDSVSLAAASDRFYIALRCGDSARAVAWADTLIRRGWGTPAWFGEWGTAAWFRVHAAVAPLRGRPDFERLVAGK